MTQYASSFSQEAVLQGYRRNVMQHGEAHDSIEALASERHCRCVFAEDADILTGHATGQGIGESAVNFNAGQVGDASVEEVSGDARTWTDFENVRPQLHALKGPRHELSFDGLSPIVGAAKPAVNEVHGDRFCALPVFPNVVVFSKCAADVSTPARFYHSYLKFGARYSREVRHIRLAGIYTFAARGVIGPASLRFPDCAAEDIGDRNVNSTPFSLT